jgi:hypothetical protein
MSEEVAFDEDGNPIYDKDEDYRDHKRDDEYEGKIVTRGAR